MNEINVTQKSDKHTKINLLWGDHRHRFFSTN